MFRLYTRPVLTQLIGYGLFAVYVVLMVVVVLNMLIGAMSDTYQRVADNADYEWLFGRTHVYVEYMLADGMPPPFNLLPTIRSTARLIGLLSNRSGGGTKSLDRGGKTSAGDDNRAEFRALMAKLIRRCFTRKE